MGAWFVPHPSALPDVLRSAEHAHENSGQRQFVHHHAHGEPCVGACREMDHFGGSGE